MRFRKLAIFSTKYLLIGALALLVAYYLSVPLGRAFLHCEWNYNEGWNLYQAQRVLDHLPLYPSKTGWTLNNYPAFSFVISAALYPFTHDLLFTGRALNVIGLFVTAILMGGIGHRLGFTRMASLLTGLFTLAVFATPAWSYVGIYDPQMLAQCFLVAAIFVYLGGRRSTAHLVLTVLLFLIGLFIKHNQIDLPLAVLVDLFLISRRRAIYSAIGAAVGASGMVALHLHLWGAAFVSLLVGGRVYSYEQLCHYSMGYALLLAFPLLMAVTTAYRERKNADRWILHFLLLFSVVLGVYFSGGIGVSVNTFFSAFLAIVLLNGASFERLLSADAGLKLGAAAEIAGSFLWLLIVPWLYWQGLNPVAELNRMRQSEAAYHDEVQFLHQHSGDAICESLLACAEGGKAFVVDPFNATREFETGALPDAALVEAIAQHRFGVIELLAQRGEAAKSHRFTPQVMAAIGRNYRIAQNAGDHVLCLPVGSGSDSGVPCQQ